MTNDPDDIRIQLDYLQGPIWISDVETGEPLTGNDIVDTDPAIRKLNKTISDLYTSYYEIDSHEQACWFNKEKEKEDKPLMLHLLKQLNDRLNVINDGSFTIDDRETPRVSAL